MGNQPVLRSQPVRSFHYADKTAPDLPFRVIEYGLFERRSGALLDIEGTTVMVLDGQWIVMLDSLEQLKTPYLILEEADYHRLVQHPTRETPA